jgi:hypothetical protein
VADDVNKGKTMTDVEIWVNGQQAVTAADNVDLDALHTTTDTMGAQGRTTEVYKQGTQWIIVYIDTFLGVVTDVTARNYDTAGHVMNPATLTIDTIDDGTGTAVSVQSSSYTKDYSYSMGDLVLLTTYGEDGITWARDKSDLLTLPADEDDFKIDTDNDGNDDTWAVDEAGAPTKVTVTVKGLTGSDTTKTGIEATNGTTYPASHVYLALDNTGAPTQNGTVAAEYIELANSMINGSYVLILDANGNIVGMEPATAAKVDVGVVVDTELVRVGTNKYAAETDLILGDGTKTTLKFVKYDTTTHTVKYFESTDNTYTHGLLEAQAFVKFNSCTLDGTVYYYVDNSDGLGNNSFSQITDDEFTVDTDGLVLTGVADTTDLTYLDGSDVVLNDTTKFLVAQYKWDYQASAYTLTGYKAYTGFKNLPTLSVVSNDIEYAVLTSGGVDYVCIQNEYQAATSYKSLGVNAYTLAVDDSYLVLSKAVTYQYYSVYNVVKNGVKTTVNVSNDLNGTIDDYVVNSNGAYAGQLVVFDGKTDDGYYTGVSASTQVALSVNGTPLNSLPYTVIDTTVATGSTVSYSKGVLTVGGTDYLTVDNNCKVQIVNSVTNTLYDGTLSSIAQYADGVHDYASGIAYELNANGYICNLYIID